MYNDSSYNDYAASFRRRYFYINKHICKKQYIILIYEIVPRVTVHNS